MTTPPWGKNAIKRASPYQRIMIAAEKGRGLRFSSIEVRALSMDAAIAQRAAMDTTCVECLHKEIPPAAKRRPATASTVINQIRGKRWPRHPGERTRLS